MIRHSSINIILPDTMKEMKAPTDESVRLLNEFEEKARKNIIDKIEVVDNTFNGLAIWYADEMQMGTNDGFTLHLKFKFNGNEYFIKKNIRRYELNAEYFNLQKYLHNELKSAIGTIVVRHIQEEIFKQLQIPQS